MLVTAQGFLRRELRIENSSEAPASFLAFQLLPEVLQACVLV